MRFRVTGVGGSLNRPRWRCVGKGIFSVHGTCGSYVRNHRNPMEIQGTAATRISPIPSATIYDTIGRMPSSGAIRLIARGVIPDAEQWREEADAHAENGDHRVMHRMHAEPFGNREQQRPEQHDCR